MSRGWCLFSSGHALSPNPGMPKNMRKRVCDVLLTVFLVKILIAFGYLGPLDAIIGIISMSSDSCVAAACKVPPQLRRHNPGTGRGPTDASHATMNRKRLFSSPPLATRQRPNGLLLYRSCPNGTVAMGYPGVKG